jgi:thymidylate synthase ThyX
LRVVSKRGFAKKNEYVVSNVVKSDPEKHKIYREYMEKIQHMYESLVDCGIPNQDARNLLPLGIYSPITMAINLRSLYHTLELRTCLNAQEEYRNVALLMKNEIAEKMGEIFTIPIHPPCEAEGVDWCPSPVWCGRNDKKPRIKFEDIKKWIKG